MVSRCGIPPADVVSRAARNAVYLVVIGWMYVVLMMSVAEATNTTGSVLGAIVTFFLYGLLPVALVVYLMRTPQRRKERKAREAIEDQARAASAQADAGGQAPGAAAGHRGDAGTRCAAPAADAGLARQRGGTRRRHVVTA